MLREMRIESIDHQAKMIEAEREEVRIVPVPVPIPTPTPRHYPHTTPTPDGEWCIHHKTSKPGPYSRL
jgi:hypothetical protein